MTVPGEARHILATLRRVAVGGPGATPVGIRRRYVLAVLAALVVAGACGSGEDGDQSSTTTAGHDHDHEAMEGIALDDLDHPPTVEAVAESDGAGNVVVTVTLTGIELVPVNPPREHQPGQGHLHITVDGETVAMTSDAVHHLTGLADGHHEVAVRLSANDHRDYLFGGAPIGDTAMVMVTGGTAPKTPDLVFAVEVADGTVVGGVQRFEATVGDLVEVSVTSDVDDELHLHAYDAIVHLHAGGIASLLVEVTIPGVFEAELHEAGYRIFELQVS